VGLSDDADCGGFAGDEDEDVDVEAAESDKASSVDDAATRQQLPAAGDNQKISDTVTDHTVDRYNYYYFFVHGGLESTVFRPLTKF